MNADDKPILASPRPLPEDRRPQRVILRLPDGYETGVYIHQSAETTGRLPVLYLHGIQSHPGWFFGSGAYLAERGYPVFQVTRRGSGAGEDDRGHAESPAQLLDDIDASCRFITARTGCGMVHLLGVSWGGKLLAAYACRRATSRRTIASLTLVAPGIAPQVDVSAVTKLKIAVSLLIQPRRMFDIPLNDAEMFTDNEPMCEYLRRDPYRLYCATARFLYVSRRLDGMLRRCRSGSLTVPAALILALRDRIIDNPATRAAVERLTAGAATVREFDGDHTLEFEPDPAPFYEALANAIESYAAS